ncbi:MAG: hypothetical protein KIT73_06420 [Burkholderiales bacterium]|nr:hypothetical protein [Burkholderiales bacterium]
MKYSAFPRQSEPPFARVEATEFAMDATARVDPPHLYRAVRAGVASVQLVSHAEVARALPWIPMPIAAPAPFTGRKVFGRHGAGRKGK